MLEALHELTRDALSCMSETARTQANLRVWQLHMPHCHPLELCPIGRLLSEELQLIPVGLERRYQPNNNKTVLLVVWLGHQGIDLAQGE